MRARRGRTARLAGALLAALCALPATASAQGEEITIALFAPTVRFPDSVARARYVTELAESVAAESGLPVRGVSVSGASDLADADFAIVDGTYQSGRDEGRVLLAGRIDGESAGPLALVVRTDGAERLSELRGGTLILPRAGGLLEDLVSNELLQGQLHASEFFAEVEQTSNVESALSAVSSGRADATIAFARDAEGSGLRVLTTLPDAPFPVVVVVREGLDDDVVERIRGALSAARAPGEPSRFGSPDEATLDRFRRAARRAPPEPNPQMAPPGEVDFEPSSLALDPAVAEPLPTPPTHGLVPVPPLDP